MSRVRLRLYAAPAHGPSQRAANELKILCARRADWALEIVELDPRTAEDVQLAPTLVRIRPAPERRVFGDLSDLPSALERLELPGTNAPMNGGVPV